MPSVTPKKKLGQHFLKDENIARKITDSLTKRKNVLEIGPGTGVLTKYLMHQTENLKVVEVDPESVQFLKNIFPDLGPHIIEADFLKIDPSALFHDQFSIIGNFPYNISSQIFFRIIEHRDRIPEVVGMVQKEVALRLSAAPGNKTYGILTVILGAFYDIRYLFTVGEQVFYPPPKIKSAVIRLTRKENFKPDCDEKMFFKIVKTAFNQRRKTLKNSLKVFWTDRIDPDKFSIFTKRPEQLCLEEFFYLTNLLSEST
ncbi:MAG: 16S rRNA (adenine(1518)-N(6)/adenine(1519)-N(6))-dimethyltransferase RsmA [Sphingobacteriia bacterium]|nr:16S rRNA (adenine(1518)-N(6)/adenine(1519)-N(6))-dimethyltransferase RsmA [Sphingobacteriia bacterium]